MSLQENIEPHDQKCPFCLPSEAGEILADNTFAYAIFDKFPVSRGHCLIIPKSHKADYFDLTPEVQNDCWSLVNTVKKIIMEKYRPDGFNIGVNVGETAGQTIHHVHIHLIPRYNGDVQEPRGGVRGVIPDKRDYLS